jgi:Ni,Fe-hydrogenase III component G
MARWYKFVIQLEYNEEPLTLEELQSDFQDAVQCEDYKTAAKIKKQIDERLLDDESKFIVELEDYCYIDLDEVATFYKSQWENGDEFTKIILKGSSELPLSIKFEEFTKLFFKLNTHENA